MCTQVQEPPHCRQVRRCAEQHKVPIQAVQVLECLLKSGTCWIAARPLIIEIIAITMSRPGAIGSAIGACLAAALPGTHPHQTLPSTASRSGSVQGRALRMHKPQTALCWACTVETRQATVAAI
mmetsp:Transcript_106468/g.194088  ORF Transcript_106468/g.194088 Transcript_106468/m.194088 type:complete len:124 (+) Transcript_106468:2060-2431(+)